jgi:hypothetical protein
LKFIFHICLAIGIVATGWYVSFSAPADADLAHYAFGIAAVAAELELFAAAWYLRSRKIALRFDMTIAAETVVAFGVFSLIGGIALAIFATRGGSLNFHDIAEGDVNSVDLNILLISFGDGLLASAFAPLLATVLRHIEVLLYAPLSETGASGDPLDLLKRDADRAAKALAQLRSEAEAAATQTASFAGAAKSILEALTELAASIKEARGAIPAALSSVSREIGNAGPGVTVAFDTVAGDIRSGGGRVAKALADTDSSLDGFKTGVTSGTETIRKMTDEFDRLGPAPGFA